MSVEQGLVEDVRTLLVDNESVYTGLHYYKPYDIFLNMCPIEAYQGGVDYLGESGSGYSEIRRPGFTIFWSGDDTAVATVTNGQGFSDQQVLPNPGDSMISCIPNRSEIVVYRK